MKRIFTIAASVAALLVLTSCQEELHQRLSSTIIKASITAEAPATKSAGADLAESFIGSAEGSLLAVDIFESEGIATAPVTKGSQLTTENFGTAKVHAYLEEEVSGQDKHYIDNGDIRVTGDVTKSGTTEPYYWLNEVNMHMWCFLPSELALNVNQSNPGTASFSYQTPSSMAEQKDIIVSHNKEFYKEGDDGIVNVTLHHALSAIRFDVRLLPANTKIQKVEIIGVQNAGTCAVNSGDAFFAWTPAGTTADFSLEETVSSDDAYLPVQNQYFFLMPQILPSNTAIAMTFLTDKGEVKRDIVTIGGNEFKAGRTYTFRVSAKYELENIIEDENGDINFKGKAFQAVAFKDLNLASSYTMKLEFDFSVGQDSKGHHRIRIVKASEYDNWTGDKRDCPGKVIYYRSANPGLFSETPAVKELVKYISVTKKATPDAGAQASGHCTIEFNVENIGDGPYHVVFDYIGGNEGNAKWVVKNLSLTIQE